MDHVIIMQSHSPKQAPPASAATREVDEDTLLLIREMLELTPDERLQQLESHAALMQELRDANPTLRLSRDT